MKRGSASLYEIKKDLGSPHEHNGHRSREDP